MVARAAPAAAGQILGIMLQTKGTILNASFLNLLLGFSLLLITVLLIAEAIKTSGLRYDLDYYKQRLEKSVVTVERLYRERNQAESDLSDAVRVITEIKVESQNEAFRNRLSFLVRSFVDRRQQEKDEAEIQAEIDKMTGGV